MEILAFLGSAALALFGGLIGYRFRVREVIRADRRHTYLQFLNAVDAFPRFYQRTEETRGGDLNFFQMLDDLRSASNDLQLVASPKVVQLVQQIGIVLSTKVPQLIDSMNREGGSGDLEALQNFISGYASATEPLRNELVAAMRKNLGVEKIGLKKHHD